MFAWRKQEDENLTKLDGKARLNLKEKLLGKSRNILTFQVT